MELRAYCKWVIITGTVLIWIIKWAVRPYIPLDKGTLFIAGIAPNLLGSFLIPFVASWLHTHPRFSNGRLLRFPFLSESRFVCLFGFFLVLINEYLQLIPVFGRTFDYFDIVFSATGLIISYYWLRVVQRRLSPA